MNIIDKENGGDKSASELRIIFSEFSKTSIKKINGDYSLVGKYVDCQFIETSWDIFIHDTKPILEGRFDVPLSARKVTNILATLPESIVAHKLSGEAYFKTNDLAWLKCWLWGNRKLLGMRCAGHKPVHSIGAINHASRIL